MADLLRRHWLLLVMAGAFLFYGLAADGRLDVGDSPRYVLLARSLAEGNGYNGVGYAGIQPETQYPFGYPILLLPLVRAFGPEAYLSFELFSVICAVLAVPALWFVLRRWLSEPEAFAVLMTSVFLAQYQKYATAILTEAPYLAASFLCLGAIQMMNKDKVPAWAYAAFALGLGVSFHLRTIGVVFLAAAFLFLVLRRRFTRAIAVAALGLAACSPWLLWVFTKGLGYAPEFEEATGGPFALVYRVGYNTASYLTKIPPDDFLYPAFSSFIPYEPLFFLKAAVGLVLSALVLRGLWLRRNDWLSAPLIYLFLYVMICFAWTAHGDRYMVPVMPILIWALLRGAGRYAKQAAFVIGGVGLVAGLVTIVEARTGREALDSAAFRDAVEWLRSNAPPSEQVLSRYPAYVTAVSGQEGTRFGDNPDPELNMQVIRDRGIRWIVVDRHKLNRVSAQEVLEPMLQKYPTLFQLRFSSPRDPLTRVYQVAGR